MAYKKNPQDALFHLIKSMSQGEKRFFNMMCSRQGSAKGKIYLKLFDAIEKQKEYNETLIKEQFKTEKFPLTETKRYLYKLVLDSLVQHYKVSDKNLYGNLLEMDVLLEKGLHTLYELLLYKVRKAAEVKNDFLIVLETFKREKRLQNFRVSYFNVAKFKKINEQENYFIDLHKEVEEYFKLSNEVISYQNDYLEVDSKELRKIAARPLFNDIKKPRALISRVLFHTIRGSYYRNLGDYKQSFKEHHKEIRMLESSVPFMKRNPLLVFGCYMNYVISCHNVKEYDKALETVVKYKDFIFHYPELKGHNMIRIYLEEFLIYKDTGKKNEAIALAAEMENEFDESKIGVANKFKILLFLNIAFTCLQFKEYQLSQKWVNKVLNYSDSEKTSFLYYYNARVLQLINIFELKDYELLEFRVRAFQRLVVKNGKLNPVDKALIGFFHKISDKKFVGNRKNMALIRGELHTAIIKAMKNNQTGQLLSYPDLSSWFENP